MSTLKKQKTLTTESSTDTYSNDNITAHNMSDVTNSDTAPSPILYTNDTVYTAIHTIQSNSVLVVLGDQLFNPALIEQNIFVNDRPTVYMAESDELCEHFAYHKIKLTLFLSAMRHYRYELNDRHWNVHYNELSVDQPDSRYLDKLKHYCSTNKITHVYHYTITDIFFEQQFNQWCTENNIQHTCIQMSGFVTTREQFTDYIQSIGAKKPFAASFYQLQRNRLHILMNSKTHKPVGGKYSYDTDNRKPLPKSVSVPNTVDTGIQYDRIDQSVIELINQRFPSHPGNAANLWLATTRSDAHKWLHKFIVERLVSFGEYEDAIVQRSPFVFHSVLTPYLNTGLLTAHEIIDAVLQYNAQHQGTIPLGSLEGFIRQVIGWREYIQGLYRHFNTSLTTCNYWQHHRKFKNDGFYSGTTGILPLDDCIKKVHKYGYLHHIERLMICGSIFMLCELEPSIVYKWYMELFIDSADWVMQPNVYGMILNVDGGQCGFTKPYVYVNGSNGCKCQHQVLTHMYIYNHRCGSNYIIKQSDGCYNHNQDWCHVVDGLYWRFVQKHKTILSKNMRMGKIVYGLDRMSQQRKDMIFGAAEMFLNRFTVLPDEYKNMDQNQYYQPIHVKVEPNEIVKQQPDIKAKRKAVKVEHEA